MKRLEELISEISEARVVGPGAQEILGLHFDSRKIQAGHLFVAVKGTQVDGHDFIGTALDAGAVAVVCEQLPERLDPQVAYVQVKDSSLALAAVASAYFDHPSRKLKLIGVTGTNGKTTVVTLLYKLFTMLGNKVGMLSTVQNWIAEKPVPSTHTTPDSLHINQLLAEMVEQGCDYCFMEVSSHAIVQHRISYLEYVGGVFTNLTHDHLDFHHSFAAYLKAKKTFFDLLPSHAFALTNGDDRNGLVMLQNTKAFKKTYALRSLADYKGAVLESHLNGMLLRLDGNEIWVRLVGLFNAYNLLAVFGTAMLLEQDHSKVLMALSKLTGAPGRFQTLVSEQGVVGIIDYAHTPDALENVLKTIADLRGDTNQIITVVGCGGNRDKAKRPVMGKVAIQWSDKVIFTSDNPRNEDPSEILKEMEAGVPAAQRRKFFTITDRREAIRAACHLALPGDVILVAGKGHETYQEIQGVRHEFDDRKVLMEAFKEE